MALMKKTQRSFAGGMLDKDLMGRQDLKKYGEGCIELTNFKVRKQGNIVKRSGTNLICDFSSCLGNAATDGVSYAKIIPLIQECERGYYILFTGKRAFLISSSGMKMTNGTWSQSPTWSASATWAADTLPEGHAFSGQPTFSSATNTWSWTDTGSQTWSAPGAAKDVTLTFSATISSETITFSATLGNNANYTVPYSIAIPFDDTDLSMLDWCQSGDTVFFAHRSYPPAKIVFSNGKLEYSKLQFRQGLGNPPTIASVQALGDSSTGTWTVKDSSSRTWYGSGSAHATAITVKLTVSGTEYVCTGTRTSSSSTTWSWSGTLPESTTITGAPTYTGSSIWTGSGGEVNLEYAVTAVKDGVETGPSVPYATSYNAPWPSGGSMKINIDSSSIDADDFDAFYIYKKISDVFGLIGTTSNLNNFVDISDGYVVGGTLYPTGFTEFDKTVHLRESGNLFAAVISTSSQLNVIQHGTGSSIAYVGKDYDVTFDSLDDFLACEEGFEGYLHAMMDYMPDWWESSYTQTAQKSGGSSIVFTLPSEGEKLTTFRIGLGSLHHRVVKQGVCDVTVLNSSSAGSALNDTITTNTTKWKSDYSEFTPCPAKYFKATVEYDNDGTWATSSPFTCRAAVDQTQVDDSWVAQSGGSAYRRTYTDSEYKISYTSASEVIARMESPAVGANVKFDIPEDYAGKKIRKITLYGYTDSTAGTAANLIVNGLACFEGGKYVYSFTDENITPDLTITPPKTEDHFVNPGEYPGCVQIYQQRLVYAASAENPFTFWMSCTGDLYNFDSHEYVRSSDSITASTAALEMPRINRMLVHRDLMLFSDGGEWQVAPASGNAVAPSTIAAKLQSVIGSASWLKPIAVDSDIVYCDREGEALYATRYNFASDGYESSNLSVLSQRLFRNNAIQSFAFAQFPESTFECVLADGTIASLVYMKEHEVCAWSLNVLGGDWKAMNVAANKSSTDGSSNVAFIARRSYSVSNDAASSGSSVTTEWAVLGLRDIDPNDKTLLANLRMDAIRVVQVTHGSTPSVGHGETAVKIGEVRTTTDGVTTVTHDKYAIGCIYVSRVLTTSPEFTNEETAQMEVKNATEAEVRVIDASAFTARQSDIVATKATTMLADPTPDTTPANFTITLSDADCKMPLVGTNTWNGSLIIEHGGYLPIAILSVSTAYRVEYANHANGGSARGN